MNNADKKQARDLAQEVVDTLEILNDARKHLAAFDGSEAQRQGGPEQRIRERNAAHQLYREAKSEFDKFLAAHGG